MKKFLSKLFVGNVVQKYSIDAPFKDVMEALEKAVTNNQFGVQAIHDLKDTYVKKHLTLDPDFEYAIVQICNAPKSHKALTQLSYDMGVMMPKSIIVARENGQTTLRYMKMKPWMVELMFPELDILPVSKQVSQTMDKIVKETIEAVS